MRVHLKGIHSVRMKLADGSVATYHYAWRGGPRLRGEPGTAEFIASFNEAHAARKKPAAGTLFGLMAEYRASSDFTQRAESTKRAYRSYLKMIEEEYGDMPLAAVEDEKARGEFKQWRDGMADRPRTADYAWTVLAKVLAFGVDRGRLKRNVCARGGRLYKADRAESIWTEDMISRFVSVASPELCLALALALWTGQRQGDLLKLTWAAYDGAHIRVRQSKTGRRVVIPVGETLRGILDQAPRRAVTILTNSDGLPWTDGGFRASWRKACAKAMVEGVTFHDIRGTAVTRLALAGCEVPEIASITGHSQRDAQDILDRHYLSRDVRLAEAAMMKLERNERRTKPVKGGVK